MKKDVYYIHVYIRKGDLKCVFSGYSIGVIISIDFCLKFCLSGTWLPCS